MVHEAGPLVMAEFWEAGAPVSALIARARGLSPWRHLGIGALLGPFGVLLTIDAAIAAKAARKPRGAASADERRSSTAGPRGSR